MRDTFSGPDERLWSKYYYKVMDAADVAPARRRIAAEVIERSRARFPQRCPRPAIVWYRESSPGDFTFIENTSLAGQAVQPLGKGDDAIEILLSSEHRTVEELVRTVAHEMKHVVHLVTYRPPSDEERKGMEHEAYIFEGLVWNDWRRDHGDVIGHEANRAALKWNAGEQV